MKKTLLLWTALAAMSLASCSSVDEPVNGGSESGTVTFTMQLPTELSSRDFADGKNATQLSYAVYQVTGTTSAPVYTMVGDVDATKTFDENLQAQVTVTLAPGSKYSILFWAQNPDCQAYNIDWTITEDHAKPTMTVDYSKMAPNDETVDAFYAVETFTATTSPTAKSVVLNRPLAQVNLGTAVSDYESDAFKTAYGTKDKVTMAVTISKAYDTLDFFTGEATGSKYKSFAAAVLPVSETYPLDGYEYVNMIYVLASKGQTTLIDYTATPYNDGKSAFYGRISVNNLPVQANYRTNIYGSLFTVSNLYNVEINPAFDHKNDVNTDSPLPRWDGKPSTTVPAIDAATKAVTLASAGDVAAVAKAINEGNAELAAANLVLDADLDLNNMPWTPIGTEQNKFTGTFDGQGHVISNLNVSVTSGQAGLFGYTPGGGSKVIKNIEVKNATIKNTSEKGTGVIAGSPYTTKYENIKITGTIMVEAPRYVGAVFGASTYSRLDNIVVDVTPDSYVKATGAGLPNHCGGVIGYAGEGGMIFSNIKSNINVISAAPGAGGIVGLANYGNTFINCESTGNVTVTSAASSSYLGVGGIAGCYSYSGNTVITFTDCKYTGTLKSYVSGEEQTLEDHNNIYGISYGGWREGYGKAPEGSVVVNSTSTGD